MRTLLLLFLMLIAFYKSYNQEAYHGFAISGNTNNSVSTNFAGVDQNLNNILGLHYYWNRNNIISFVPRLNFTRSDISNTTSSNVSFGLSYKYIYWFYNRIGVQSSINFDGIGNKELSFSLGLSSVIRLTSSLDFTINLAQANLYAVSKFSSTLVTNVNPNKTTIYKSTTFGISEANFSKLGFRYRIPAFNEGIDVSNYNPKQQRSFGIRLIFNKSKTEQTTLYTGGSKISNFTEMTDLGVGYIIKPFSKISYSLNLNYNNINNSSPNFYGEEIKLIEISPLIRRNYLYADGFGMFMEGGPRLGKEYGDTKHSTYGFTFEAGFTYIIKNRIMVDCTLSSLTYRHKKGGYSNRTALQFDPFSIAKVSGTVLF